MKFSTLFATKRARVIAITVAAMVLVLAILTPILLYAGGYIMPFDADGQPSERLLNRIERDYGKKLFGTEYDSKKHGEIQILCCYGDYSGSIPVILGGSGAGDVMTEEWSEKISQYEFWYSERCRIEVWHEGSFYNLQEAYDKGLLMEKDLGLIAKIHYDKNVSDFGENFNK